MVEQGGTFNGKRIRGIAFAAALLSLCVSGAERRDKRRLLAQSSRSRLRRPRHLPEAPQSLHLLVGRSLVITSPTRIKRISLADPAIAEALCGEPLSGSAEWKSPGRSFLSAVGRIGAEPSRFFEVTVDLDILQLSAKLKEAFPAEPVTAEAAGRR